MPHWPEPEQTRPPEGHYSFRLNKEPELRNFTRKDGKEGKKIVLFAIALGDAGTFQVMEHFVPWDPRYKDLCNALGVEHGKDIRMEGAVFEADIKYEMDKDNPTKSYARIVNIVTQEDIPPSSEGVDVPF